MKTRTILCAFGGFLSLVLLAGCGPRKYVPTANEEIYGTWINDGIKWQRLVVFAGGEKWYVNVTDADADMEATDQIIAKWKDSDGNIWYKTFHHFTRGTLSGMNGQYLWKISNGSQMELTGEFVKDFSEKRFPVSLRSDPTADHRSYQRSRGF